MWNWTARHDQNWLLSEHSGANGSLGNWHQYPVLWLWVKHSQHLSEGLFSSSYHVWSVFTCAFFRREFRWRRFCQPTSPNSGYEVLNIVSRCFSRLFLQWSVVILFSFCENTNKQKKKKKVRGPSGERKALEIAAHCWCTPILMLMEPINSNYICLAWCYQEYCWILMLSNS